MTCMQRVNFLSPESGRGERALYIDDDSSIVFLTGRILERLGYQVTSCEGPQEGLNAFAPPVPGNCADDAGHSLRFKSLRHAMSEEAEKWDVPVSPLFPPKSLAA
jgi:DNA-binding NtrC family response regulator